MYNTASSEHGPEKNYMDSKSPVSADCPADIDSDMLFSPSLDERLTSLLYTVLRSTEYSRKNSVEMSATPANTVVTIHIAAIERAHACNIASRRVMSCSR